MFKVLHLGYNVHYFIKKKEELASSQTPVTRIAFRFFLFINISTAAFKATIDVTPNALHKGRGHIHV